MSEKYGMVEIQNEELYMEDLFELSKQLYAETLSFLMENKDLLVKVSEELIIKETLNTNEVKELIGMNTDEYLVS